MNTFYYLVPVKPELLYLIHRTEINFEFVKIRAEQMHRLLLFIPLVCLLLGTGRPPEYHWLQSQVR